MRFCPQCGSQLPEGVKFCTGCGSSVAAPAVPVAPAPAEVKKSKINWPVFVIMILVGLLIVGGGIAVIADIATDGECNLFGLLDGGQEEDDENKDEDRDEDNDRDKDPSGADADDGPNAGETPDATTSPNGIREFSYKEFHITLSDAFVMSGDNRYRSADEQTEIYANCWDLKEIAGVLALEEDEMDAESIADEYLESQGAVERLRDHDGVSYISGDYFNDSGDYWTSMTAFYVTEDHFWCIQFHHNGEQQWEDLDKTWFTYLESIWFS